jgi:flagellar biosynthesis protein FliQ
VNEEGVVNLAYNEQIKLAATFWNNAGVAALVTGVVVPMFGDEPSFWEKTYFIVLGVAVAVVFHFIGSIVLNKLRE